MKIWQIKQLKVAFKNLLTKILLNEDIKKLSGLNISEIKELVSYYQIADEQKTNFEKISFNVYFDKDKLHRLFLNRNLIFSDISDKDLYLLPVIQKKNQIFIYNKNFFYQSWNYNSELIEFIFH